MVIVLRIDYLIIQNTIIRIILNNIKEEILININSNDENGLSKSNTLITQNVHFCKEPIFRKYNFVKNKVTDIEYIFFENLLMWNIM